MSIENAIRMATNDINIYICEHIDDEAFTDDCPSKILLNIKTLRRHGYN